MTDQPLTAYESALQDAESLRRDPSTGLFPGTRPSPSQRPQHRHDLIREIKIIWVVPEDQARALPFARERFGRPLRHQKGLIAKAVDGAGRAVRYWVAKPEDLSAYSKLLQKGCGTAPIEAIWPPTIAAGRPALPAHPFLLPAMWANIAADEGAPVELPQPDPAAETTKLVEVERAFWRGLHPGEGGQSDG